MNLFFDILKRDDAQRMVYGYCSTEALDSQGEVVEKAAIVEAFDDFMQWANLREMHQPSAVGVVKEVAHDEKGTFIGAKVVDDAAWTKVVEGVYKGFSIGGTRLEKVGERVKRLRLREISLVDRPANPEARITMIKFDDPEDEARRILKALGVEHLLNASAADAGAAIQKADLDAAEQRAEQKATEIVKASVDPLLAKLGTIEVAIGDIRKLYDDKLAAIEKAQKDAHDALTERVKKLEDQPVPTSAHTRSVSKVDDGKTTVDRAPKVGEHDPKGALLDILELHGAFRS